MHVHKHHMQGDIFINGIRMDDVRDWYTDNTGYMLQAATPYYEELTVRENLTLAAAMKLPDKTTWRERFERVEQVMEVVSTIVGCHVFVYNVTYVGGASR